MEVCRKRSTKRVPASLSISYLIGSPPTGTSMMTLTSCGGFLPIEMASMRMEGSAVARLVQSSYAGLTRVPIALPKVALGNDGLPGQVILKTHFALSSANDIRTKVDIFR